MLNGKRHEIDRLSTQLGSVSTTSSSNQKLIFLRKDFWMLSPDQMAELFRSATCGEAFRWLSPKNSSE